MALGNSDNGEWTSCPLVNAPLSSSDHRVARRGGGQPARYAGKFEIRCRTHAPGEVVSPVVV
jgi:hypothetical protein